MQFFVNIFYENNENTYHNRVKTIRAALSSVKYYPTSFINTKKMVQNCNNLCTSRLVAERLKHKSKEYIEKDVYV